MYRDVVRLKRAGVRADASCSRPFFDIGGDIVEAALLLFPLAAVVFLLFPLGLNSCHVFFVLAFAFLACGSQAR